MRNKGADTGDEPMLLVLHGEDKKQQTFYNLSQHEYETNIRTVPQMRGGKQIATYGFGWIVVYSKDKGSFLVNLTSMEKIELPNSDFIPIACALSSPPTTDRSAGNCHVLFVDSHSKFRFCQPGDKKYLEQEFIRSCTGKQIAISRLLTTSERKIYGVSPQGVLVSIEFEGTTSLRVTQLIYFDDEDSKVKTLLPISPQASIARSYVLEFGGNMYVVRKLILGRRVDDDVADFVIYKINPCDREWIKVTSLGSYVILLDPYARGVMCRSTPENGLRRNSIYYLVYGDNNIYSWDLDRRSILTHSSLPFVKTSGKKYEYCWFLKK